MSGWNLFGINSRTLNSNSFSSFSKEINYPSSKYMTKSISRYLIVLAIYGDSISLPVIKKDIYPFPIIQTGYHVLYCSSKFVKHDW